MTTKPLIFSDSNVTLLVMGRRPEVDVETYYEHPVRYTAEPGIGPVCTVCRELYEDYYGECRACHDRLLGLDHWGQA